MSSWFEFLGTDEGGMFVTVEGLNKEGMMNSTSWYVIATDGFGPFIPSMPSVIIARKLQLGAIVEAGAKPCVGLFDLEDFAGIHSSFPIRQFIEEENGELLEMQTGATNKFPDEEEEEKLDKDKRKEK